MYCPQCSQQQVSDEMRFCSRCGFPLSSVIQLMATGGIPTTDTSRRTLKGYRQGTWIILASFLCSLFVAFLTAIDDDFAFLFFPCVIGFLVGIARLVYSVVLQNRAKRKDETQINIPPTLPRPTSYPELGAQRDRPVDVYAPSIRQTAEVIQPPSVTESTTRLLDDNGDAERR